MRSEPQRWVNDERRIRTSGQLTSNGFIHCSRYQSLSEWRGLGRKISRSRFSSSRQKNAKKYSVQPKAHKRNLSELWVLSRWDLNTLAYRRSVWEKKISAGTIKYRKQINTATKLFRNPNIRLIWNGFPSSYVKKKKEKKKRKRKRSILEQILDSRRWIGLR